MKVLIDPAGHRSCRPGSQLPRPEELPSLLVVARFELKPGKLEEVRSLERILASRGGGRWLEEFHIRPDPVWRRPRRDLVTRGMEAGGLPRTSRTRLWRL